MSRCNKCGNELPVNSGFCIKCGEKVVNFKPPYIEGRDNIEMNKVLFSLIDSLKKVKRKKMAEEMSKESLLYSKSIGQRRLTKMEY